MEMTMTKAPDKSGLYSLVGTGVGALFGGPGGAAVGGALGKKAGAAPESKPMALPDRDAMARRMSSGEQVQALDSGIKSLDDMHPEVKAQHGPQLYDAYYKATGEMHPTDPRIGEDALNLQAGTGYGE